MISPERILFDGDVSSVVAPAFDGEVGILPRHAPMVALLGRGTVRLTDPGGAVRRFDVSGGFLQVVGDIVLVVTDTARPLA